MHRITNRLGLAILDKFGLAVLLGVSVLVLISCDSKDSGPAQQVGKEIDKATVSVGKQVEKAGESIQDAGKADKP